MHQSGRGLQTSKSQLFSTKSRALSTFDGGSQYSSNPNPVHFTNEKRLEPRINETNSPRNQDTYDALPSFGEETRYGSTGVGRTGSKVSISQDFQNENLARLLKEPKARPIETSRSQLTGELTGRGGLDSQTSRSHHQSSRDLKNSGSYLNAMRALQEKIKKLEDQIDLARRDQDEIERRHEKEVDVISRRFDEERRTLLDLENNLKTRLALQEDELKERERTIDSLGTETERVRRMAHDSEVEQATEMQRVLNEKARLKSEYRELEGKYEERGRLEEELRGRISHLDYALKEKDSFAGELRDRIGFLEKEKIDKSYQFEQKLTELVTKLKQVEERNRELEAESQEEARRRVIKDGESEREINGLKMVIRDLESKHEQSEQRIKDKESELIEKGAQMLNLKDEIQTLLKELEKTKMNNERTNYYAQDMAKINQRLISNLSDKSRGHSQTGEELGFAQTPHRTFSTQLPQGTEESSFSLSRRQHQQNLPLQMTDHKRSESKGTYKTPKSSEKIRGLSTTTKGWTNTSPNLREEASLYQGPKLSGEDLGGSGHYERGVERSTSRSGRKDRSANKETGVDKMQHELVIKEIIEVEKETLEWNREYQRLSNDMMGLDRESGEYRSKKKRVDEIANKLQDLSAHLIHLKRKEEEITRKFRF